MNIKKISYLAGAMLIAVASANFVDVEAAPKKTKAKTSVSSKKKEENKDCSFYA